MTRNALLVFSTMTVWSGALSEPKTRSTPLNPKVITSMPVPQNLPDTGLNHLRVSVFVIFRCFQPWFLPEKKPNHHVLPKRCEAGAKLTSRTASLLNGTWKGSLEARSSSQIVVYITAVHFAVRHKHPAHAVSMLLCQEKVPYHICIL